MNVKPLSDRVVIRPIEQEEVKQGNIIIPDTAKEKPMHGEIVAIGPGRISDNGSKIEMSVKKGDKVLYGKYAGTEVTIDGEDYLILRESDILAVV